MVASRGKPAFWRTKIQVSLRHLIVQTCRVHVTLMQTPTITCGQLTNHCRGLIGNRRRQFAASRSFISRPAHRSSALFFEISAVLRYPSILLPGAPVPPGLLVSSSDFRAPCVLRVLSVVLLRI